MAKRLFQSCLTLFVIALTYFWTANQSLNRYNLQAAGFAIIFYSSLKLLGRRVEGGLPALDSIFLTAVSLLLVFSTGMAGSPLFFILYFLLFSISLFYDPLQGGLLALALTAIFIRQMPSLSLTTLANLFSLLLITPLAMFFGRKNNII